MLREPVFQQSYRQRAHRRHCKAVFHFSLYRKEIALGIPTALEFFCWNASNLVLIRFLNGISIEATAIYT
ncbi:MAG: hypothetical protein PUC65_06560, partial [Clostridiales bacterium]|nr:hypothetical protein [Clostridiales bacterium]